jgi:hypothetical protein
MKFTTRPIEWCIFPEGKNKYDDLTTHVKIVDEGAGEFVNVTQPFIDDYEGVSFSLDEWESIKECVEGAFKEIKKHSGSSG